MKDLENCIMQQREQRVPDPAYYSGFLMVKGSPNQHGMGMESQKVQLQPQRVKEAKEKCTRLPDLSDQMLNKN